MLASAPIYWSSKLQTIIALSTAKIELISPSEATRFIKSITYLVGELHDRHLIATTKPQICCQIFEDNEAALEISKTPKIRPRSRHINVIYHHFRSEVHNARITIESVKSSENLADILTKQLDINLFRKHRLKINGW